MDSKLELLGGLGNCGEPERREKVVIRDVSLKGIAFSSPFLYMVR
jgi:hypothetical protein